MNFSSTLVENAVNELARLPGIGRKTALRMALHLLRQPEEQSLMLANAISQMRQNVKYCSQCCNVSDTAICNICANTARNKRLVCVVENIRDVMAIEATQQFNGLYHVLGGVISPLDGIGPDKLTIDSLIERIARDEVEELVFALNPNLQGDTTIFFIKKRLEGRPITVTAIARGISFGGELEYADEFTLARSLQNRMPVDNYVK